MRAPSLKILMSDFLLVAHRYAVFDLRLRHVVLQILQQELLWRAFSWYCRLRRRRVLFVAEFIDLPVFNLDALLDRVLIRFEQGPLHPAPRVQDRLVRGVLRRDSLHALFLKLR